MVICRPRDDAKILLKAHVHVSGTSKDLVGLAFEVDAFHIGGMMQRY